MLFSEAAVDILDEIGEPCKALLQQRGQYLIAVKLDGLLLLPGAYTVLSDATLKVVEAANARSHK